MRIDRALRLGGAVWLLACDGGPTAPVAPLEPAVTPPSALFQSGDRVAIDVVLSGCFHDFHLVASLRVDADSAIVERFVGSGNLSLGYHFEPVGALSARELASLEEMLREYRRPAEGLCTSSERGSIRVEREGETVHVEAFDDSTCRWFVDVEPAFYWFKLAKVVNSTSGAG